MRAASWLKLCYISRTCYTRRRRWSRGFCCTGIQLLVVMVLLNIAWLFFALPEEIVSILSSDQVHVSGAVFDGGIKLSFVAANKVTNGSKDDHNNVDIPRTGLTSARVSNEKSHGQNSIDELNSTTGSSRNESKYRNISLSGSSSANKYPFWCSGRSTPTLGSLPGIVSRNNRTEEMYFLSAVLLVRIYAYDPARLTTREMIQWLQYLRYAGIEHVYVYDAYLFKNESQLEPLRCFIEGGFVTYVDWSHRARPRYTIAGTQVSAYQDCVNKYGYRSAWQTAIDIDEYPFAPGDTSPGFLTRFVKAISTKRGSDTAEISMQNYLYLGKPFNDSEHPLIFDRMWRRTITAANNLVKPIYRPKQVSSASVHHNALRRGFDSYVPGANLLRMNHYWGARLQHWGEDTPEIQNKTVEDFGMREAVAALTPCVHRCPVGCCR